MTIVPMRIMGNVISTYSHLLAHSPPMSQKTSWCRFSPATNMRYEINAEKRVESAMPESSSSETELLGPIMDSA
jgi:hypothetical protein